MPDSYDLGPAILNAPRPPVLAERFLAPPGFIWGGFSTADGAVLRWGYLAAEGARAECVLVGGFGDFIEKQFETIRDLAAHGLSVWCLDWRGQGGSTRPKRWPHRPRARRFERDAAELAAFAAAKLQSGLPRVLIAHSMGGAIALLCLHRHPDLFQAAILSAPMLGLLNGRTPPTLLRALTGPARLTPLGLCRLPGTYRWRPSSPPTPERSRISSDAERCRIRHAWVSSEPGLRLDQPTYGWLDPALALIARIGKPRFLAAIKTPILLGSAGREHVVAPAAHHRAARRLPDCTLFELPESKHEPFMERDAIRDQWFERIDRFLAERLGEEAGDGVSSRCAMPSNKRPVTLPAAAP
ncbi:MAG TPA: alpha/beta hydrolase [Stellaceae bacterium]|nr:alpha/beta hydrolase [Stellaceae bacterium]